MILGVKYICLCSPENAMTVKEFAQHMKDAHNEDNPWEQSDKEVTWMAADGNFSNTTLTFTTPSGRKFIRQTIERYVGDYDLS